MKRRKGNVDSEASALLFVAVFFGFLLLLGTQGGDIFQQSVNPDQPDCDNQSSGFECSKSLTDQIGKYIGATSDNSAIQYVVFTPLALLIGWVIIKIFPFT